MVEFDQKDYEQLKTDVAVMKDRCATRDDLADAQTRLTKQANDLQNSLGEARLTLTVTIRDGQHALEDRINASHDSLIAEISKSRQENASQFASIHARLAHTATNAELAREAGHTKAWMIATIIAFVAIFSTLFQYNLTALSRITQAPPTTATAPATAPAPNQR